MLTLLVLILGYVFVSTETAPIHSYKIVNVSCTTTSPTVLDLPSLQPSLKFLQPSQPSFPWLTYTPPATTFPLDTTSTIKQPLSWSHTTFPPVSSVAQPVQPSSVPTALPTKVNTAFLMTPVHFISALPSMLSNISSVLDMPSTNPPPSSLPSFRFKRDVTSDNPTVSTYPLTTVYVPKKDHYFRKAIPFKQIEEQIQTLQFSLQELDPDNTNNQYVPIQGAFHKFVQTNTNRLPSQNLIKCAEIDGEVISWQLLNKERISVNQPTLLSDQIHVSDTGIQCNIAGQQAVDDNCIKIISSTARAMDIFFSNKSVPTTYQETIKNHSNSRLYLILTNSDISLQTIPQTTTICTTPTINPEATPDQLTTIIKRKFFHHLSAINQQVLEALHLHTMNLQKTFLLLLDTKMPGPNTKKPFADVCKSFSRLTLFPTPAAVTPSPSSSFSTFFDQNKVTIDHTYTALKSLYAKTTVLCKDPDNFPLITKIYHSLLTQQLNIQSHLIAYAKHRQATNSVAIPTLLPFLFSAQNTASDISQVFASVIHKQLSPSDLQFLFVLIENEKISSLNWLNEFIPDATIPELISMQSLIPKAVQQIPPKMYAPNPELASSTLTNNIRAKPNNALYQSDDPSLPATILPNILESSHPTIDPTFVNPEILMNTPVIINSLTLQRRKRAPYFYTGFFSAVTGLATQESIETIQKNEDNMKLAEEQTNKQLQLVQTQTNKVIENIREQASRLSKLYKDDSEIKTELKKIFNDENMTLRRLSALATTFEIFSDVSVEYGALTGMLSLIPYMIQEAEECINSVLTQTVKPSLLPTSDLRKTIPIHSRASMLTAQSTLSLSMSEFYVTYKLHEFHPAFLTYHIATLPFSPQTKGYYLRYNLPIPYVAMNNLHETFIYDHAVCSTKHGITMCLPQHIQIHRKPASCAEQLLQPNQSDINYCQAAATMFKPSKQSFIYTNDLKTIRLFSPVPDNATYVCNSQISNNTIAISAGYTDISFKSTCTLLTSQLSLINPHPPSDENDDALAINFPDLSQAMDVLANDISEIHKINLTSLTEDFHKLTQAINVSEIDVASLQTELTQMQAIADITSFNPLHVDIKTIPTISTATAVMMWVILALIVIVISFGCYLCLPTYFLKAIISSITLIFRLLFNSIRCMFTACKKLYNSSNRRETDVYFQNVRRDYPSIFEESENSTFQPFRNIQNVSPPPTYGTPPSYNLLQINTNQPARPISCLSPTQETHIVFSESHLIYTYDLHVSTDRAYICTENIDRKTSANIKVYFHNLKHRMVDGQFNYHDDIPTPPPEIFRKLQEYWMSLPNQRVLKDNNAIRLYANPHILFDKEKLIFAKYSEQNTFEHYIFGLKYIPT
jgi:hypothetical protein